jgi:outer membrane cobalamin receptor
VVSAEAPGTEPVPALEITDADIERRNAKTLDKALELLPGIDVSKGAKGTPRVNIRGFRSRHTLLLLNGIPINSTYDGQFDPHLIPTENIAKIKVSYGSHSVLYGQGGLAGVINIITKQGTPGLHGQASGEMDERGNHYTRANLSGGNDRVNFFTSVSNADSDGFLLSEDFTPTSLEDGSVRENSDDERLSFFGNIGFQMDNDIEIGLTLERSVGEFGAPPSTVDDRNDPFRKSEKYDRTEDFETFSGQVSLSYDPEGMLGFRAWAFANRYTEDTARYDDHTYTSITNRNNYTSSDETSIQGATLQTSLDFGASGRAIVSFSGEKDEYTSDLKKILRTNDPFTSFHYDHDLEIYSTALEYRAQAFSRLDITAGYSHHWQRRDTGKDDDKASYAIGAGLKLTDTTRLRASYARKIRFPSIQQIYDPTSGSADLEPETSDNYEAGITWLLPWKIELDLAVFQNDVENYIEKNDTTDRYENNEAYQFKGFEIRLARQILENGAIALAYSLLDTQDKSAGTQRDELQYRPKHKYTIAADYTWDFGLTAHANFMHVAEQYHYSDSFQKGRLADYSIVNLNLEQKLYTDNFFIYLGVDNLFDENYEESYGFSQAGRTGYAGVRVKF